MGVQTRSSSSSSPVKSSDSIAKIIGPEANGELYKAFVLPPEISPEARFVVLKHPRNGVKCHFLFCPSKGLFEMTRVGPTALDYRSMLFTPDKQESPTKFSADPGPIGRSIDTPDFESRAYVNKLAELFIATPFDLIFFILPILDRPLSSQKVEPGKGLFRPLDDLVEESVSEDHHLRLVLTDMVFRPQLLDAVNQISDSIDAGDDRLYRLNFQKLFACIMFKARAATEKGLPASLEERFVTRKLDLPVQSVEREVDSVGSMNKDEASELRPDLIKSAGESVMPNASSATSVDTANHRISANLYSLQRLRIAISFIVTSHLGSELGMRLMEGLLQSKCAPDFRPLDVHLELVGKLRAEVLATRSLSDFRKRTNGDGGDADLERAEKKQKREDEERKKGGLESRGIRDLKKTDTSGMKKMSAFFTKKPSTTKPKV